MIGCFAINVNAKNSRNNNDLHNVLIDYAERGNRQLLSFHDEFRILEKYRNRIMKRMHFESARAHWHKNR